MIVLDTNILSELMRAEPEPRVIAWLDGQSTDGLHLTTITLAEIRYGIARLPSGRKRASLMERFEFGLLPRYAGRILAFDEPASREHARLRAAARAAGRPLLVVDAMIAAICSVHGYALATRNVADFEGTGIELVNPWS